MLKTIESQRQGWRRKEDGDELAACGRTGRYIQRELEPNWFRVCPRSHKQRVVKELSCATMMFFNHACCPWAFIQIH